MLIMPIIICSNKAEYVKKNTNNEVRNAKPNARMVTRMEV